MVWSWSAHIVYQFKVVNLLEEMRDGWDEAALGGFPAQMHVQSSAQGRRDSGLQNMA